MARRSFGMGQGETSDVNINDSLTPMLDVVFIMLIFFIVTATFIKQAGDVEKNKNLLPGILKSTRAFP